jgi:SET domain-containing protein
MAFLEKQLVIKRSKLPKSGKGLFTTKAISKGERIVEYKGKVRTWKEIMSEPGFNGYVYYITRNRVIDALKTIKTFGRYANDARGLTKIKSVTNNATYVMEDGKVYIDALKNIPAGGEILVSYGKEYWQIVKQNHDL